MDRNSHAAAAFGVEVFKKITGAKLLVVGAGGIGA
jgi:tRNA A37 threonylcarbamoyladenosine dehydratase